MTFELSEELLAVRARARAVAAVVKEAASDVDRTASVSPALMEDAASVCGSEPLALAIAVEEIATASAAVAICGARRASPGAATFGLAGLRGAAVLDESPRSQLILAATALGIGRRALECALDEIRQTGSVAGADVEKPHWAVADAATEVEAARLLTYKAAKTASDADLALARLMASSAAQRAVDTALRVAGPKALQDGHVLERLSRDVRAVALVLGTEEKQRSVAADGLLPH